MTGIDYSATPGSEHPEQFATERDCSGGIQVRSTRFACYARGMVDGAPKQGVYGPPSQVIFDPFFIEPDDACNATADDSVGLEGSGNGWCMPIYCPVRGWSGKASDAHCCKISKTVSAAKASRSCRGISQEVTDHVFAMSPIVQRFFLRFPAALSGWMLLCGGGPALAATVTQTLSFHYGWNAVWLEVAPVDSSGTAMRAEQAFASADFAVDRIATQARQAGSAEFSTDPARLSNQPGWVVWSKDAASGQTGAFLAEGHRAYLVHVSRTDGTANDGPLAGTLEIRGNASFWEPDWSKGSYNLVGFSISGSPTLESLLSAAGITPESTAGQPIHRLNPATGRWDGISLKEAVEPGRAYWTPIPFALVSPSYHGPIGISFQGSKLGALALGGASATVEVLQPGGSGNRLRLSPTEMTFSSLEPVGGASHSVTLSLVSPPAGSAGDQDLRLFPLERVPNQLAWQVRGFTPLAAAWSIGTLGPQESRTVTLGLDRNWSSGGNLRENLYRIDVALPGGTYYQYLPVSARNDDLAPQVAGTDAAADPGLAGLWLGSVAVDSVSSLLNATQAVRPASTTAPLRLLLHVGTNSQATLLANVTRMQTKTAGPAIPPQEVLILDETQIPFYEGLQERGGKKVGIRYETAFFDMPRLYGADAQNTNLLQRIAGPNKPVGQLTDQEVQAYLAVQSSRPPDLREAYALRFPLRGTFLPGQGVGTATNAPLRLDAFHRSNPFRHAFHPQHGVSYTIERSLTVALDGDYRPGSGVLTGTYQEVTTGLSTVPIVSRGRIRLQRVSTTTTLQ